MPPILKPGVEPANASNDDLIAASNKFSLLDAVLKELPQQKSKVVLFAQFAIMLDTLEDFCKHKSYTYICLRSDSNAEERKDVIQKFQNENISIFMFTTRTGGVELNLQSANSVIIYHTDWNPAIDNRAIARVHRISQTKRVKTE